MRPSDELQDRLFGLARPEIELLGLELLELELLRGGGRTTLRFTVDKSGGAEQRVDIDECAEASRALGRVFDAEGDELPLGRYVIEVSSPGIFRRLTRPEHFSRHVGELLKVVAEHEDDPSRTFQLRGRLLEADDAGIEVEADGEERRRIAFARIRKAHLDPDLAIGRGRDS